MPTMLIVAVLGYVPGMPIVLRLIAHAQKKMFVDRKIASMPKTKAAQKNIPKPIWSVWRERLQYARKDKRSAKIGGTRRNLYFILLGAGLVVTVVAALLEFWAVLPLGYLLYFVATFYAVQSSKDVVETRKKVLQKMYQIAVSKSLVDNEYAENPGAVISVLDWRDEVKPTKAQFQIKTEFNEMSAEGFMQQFNQVFGAETAWVPTYDKETNTPGWNFAEGVLTINEVPPLPTMAKWDEHYVLDENIAWSFFPLALGVENGVELTNPATGEVENVLGFDLSGEQPKMSKKTGVKVDSKIVTSPMCLIAGGTGGGKALSVDTKVKILQNP